MATRAERQRRYRQRQRRGEAVYRVAASDGVVLALLSDRLLTEDEAGDPVKTAAAMTIVLEVWARRRRE